MKKHGAVKIAEALKALDLNSCRLYDQLLVAFVERDFKRAHNLLAFVDKLIKSVGGK